MSALARADMQRAVDALIGLAAFPAEQVDGDVTVCSASTSSNSGSGRGRPSNSRRGRNFWRGGETFADIGGCENVKTFLRAVLAGSGPPRVVVFLDEIEKAFAGTGTDSSGVKTEMTGTMLTLMQDTEADGLIFIGSRPGRQRVPRNSAGIPTIAFDLGAMGELARWRLG